MRYTYSSPRTPFCFCLQLLKLFFFVASVLALSCGTGSAGSWYVANTASSEWIVYKNVWLSQGSYRFTARAASTANGSKLRIEVDNVVVQWSVPIPNTGRPDSFTYVSLGNRSISQGYHDIKVFFESGNVSLDWFMLSKDPDTSTSVKTSDITMVRPNTDGMLIAPVVGFEHKTGKPGVASSLCSVPETDANGNAFSDTQLRTWYSVPMYRDYDRRSDRYWDILVDELLASRAQVPLLHCRETSDFTRGLQDRDYDEGPGAYEGRWLQKFSEAVARNPQAASALKIGMFWESGGIATEFKKRFGYTPSWGDPSLVDYVMQYWLNPWFDNIPSSLLYQPMPGRPIISFFASRPDNIIADGRMSDFLMAVRSKLNERYKYDPLFILPIGGDVDSMATSQGWGQAPWMRWDGPLLETNIFANAYWATTSNGSRRRLDTVWLNDWNPSTNTGTPNSGDANGHDSFQSRLTSAGDSVLLNNFSTADNMGVTLVQEEGFTNISEGNSVFRSYHPGWQYPNQHLAAMRAFADPSTQTLLFEAEACDTYSKVAWNGNDGGSFRYEWYPSGNSSGDLDVYRPLHNLQSWITKNSGPGNLNQISTGFFDVWAVASDGKLWAQPIMGEPNAWHQVSAPNLTSVSVGKEYVWALNGTTVYSTKIPYRWSYYANTGWTQRSGNITQLSVGDTEVWGVNSSGQIFRRPLDGSGDWSQVSGTMTSVTVGDTFVWGMNGSSIYYTRTSNFNWIPVSNPNNITKIAIGSEEVWGVTASGQVFRRSVSGIGNWDSVSGPGATLTSITIGEGYMWGLAGGTPYTTRLEGFLGTSSLAPMVVRAEAGNGKVTLSWTAASGATGYNVKRGTTSGGPYSTIASNVQPGTISLNYVDSGASNGTDYYYVVSALTLSGETANSEQAIATPQSQVPASPSNLTAIAGSGNKIILSWKDNSTNERGFKIERKNGSAGVFVPMAVVDKNTTTFVDPALGGPDYYYRVRAYTVAGDSGYTNEASFPTSGNLLDRSGWTATASVSAGGNPPSNVLDNNSNTRWGTGTAQSGGQWFQVDMGALKTVYQINLEMPGGDYPRGFEVYLSADGVNWGSSVAGGTGMTNLTVIPFDSQSARYIRIKQTGSTGGAWWSIAEFKVYGELQALSRSGWTATASSSAGGQPPSNALDGSLSTRWSTGASQTNGQWFQVDMGSSQTFKRIILDATGSNDDYPRGYQVQFSNDAVNWTASAATGSGTSSITVINFSQQNARYIRITQTGSNGLWWSIHEFNVYGDVQAMPRTGWTATTSSSAGGQPPSNALDGSLSTRWSTGASQTNGQWFQVDMGSSKTFNRIILDTTGSNGDYPRGYQVQVSNDGVNWGASVSTGSGTSAITTIDFAQQNARYIRVTQTASGQTGNWWSIHEFNVYQ
jgi:hypothetical protein